MLALNLALVVSALAAPALAHFTLDYPPTRGFDEDIEPEFCGGFPDVSAVRTPFPLSNGSLSIDSHHTKATFSVLIALSSDPTSNSDFSNGTTVPFVLNYTSVGEGEYCFETDIATALASLNVANGTNATLMARYDGGDGDLFQCADVVLLTDISTPANETCASVLAEATSTSSAGASSTAPASASASASGTSGTEGVVTRAGALAVVLGIAGVVAAVL